MPRPFRAKIKTVARLTVVLLAGCMSACIGRLGSGVTSDMLAEPATQFAEACSTPRHRDLDFWLGEWKVKWDDPETGETLEGRNRVERVLEGCAIRETFDGRPGLPLQGISMSNYHPTIGEWRQLWLDNEGGYLPFAGGPVEDRFILSLIRRTPDAPHRRMIFETITPTSLVWRWQMRATEDRPWRDLWVLTYRRLGA